jgi:ankyrin repeat protein
VADIIDVLVSALGSKKWQYVGDGGEWPEGGHRAGGWVATREGDDLVKILKANLYYRSPQFYYQTLKVEGPILRFTVTIDVCDHRSVPWDCAGMIENEVEVVSKTLVKFRQKVIEPGFGLGFRGGENFSGEYRIAKEASINAKDGYGSTPLQYAESNNDKDVADLLKKHGAK